MVLCRAVLWSKAVLCPSPIHKRGSLVPGLASLVDTAKKCLSESRRDVKIAGCVSLQPNGVTCPSCAGQQSRIPCHSCAGQQSRSPECPSCAGQQSSIPCHSCAGQQSRSPECHSCASRNPGPQGVTAAQAAVQVPRVSFLRKQESRSPECHCRASSSPVLSNDF